ncbi:PAS domain S-box protein [Xylophilus sp. Kf1]|nr:PAS domain S-box protein [Xylophilus sp. Kf1]
MFSPPLFSQSLLGSPSARWLGSAPLWATVSGLLTLALVAAVASLWRQRAAARRARANENRLLSIMNGTVEGIVMLNARGWIIRFNRSAERVTGRDSSDMLGRDLRTILSVQDEMLDAYLAGHPLPDGTAPISGIVRELEIRHADGHSVAARLSIGRIQVPGEQLFVAFLSEIGELKETERALREREAQYGALIRNIPGTFFRVKMALAMPAVFVSEQIHSIVGWPAVEFTSGRRHLADLLHPEDLPRVRAMTVAAAARPGMHDFLIEFRLIHADGSHRWVSATCEMDVPPDGGTPCIDGVMIDITDAKQRAVEFEGTVRAVDHSLAVVEFDVAGHVIEANDNYLALTGYSLDELRGQRHAVFCDPAYVASPAYGEFWNTLRRGELHSGEYQRIGRDGRALWLQASYNPVLGSDGRLLKIVKFASDITARRAVEQTMREARDRAENAAASRTAFLANMSHEIRTPMNAVIGFTELLMDTPLSPVQQRHLDTIRHSASSLLGLLNDILDTAKMEKGAMELEMRDFSLRELSTQVSDAMRAAAQAKGVALLLDYPADLQDRFEGDALRLRQVLVNLISNAVKFTEQGSVQLVVRADDRPGVEAPEPSTALRIAVRDTGIGIPPDRMDAIFQPFAQADASMSRRFGGSGLGITIARQLVELMGGDITVDSRIGQGSVFTVRLSLAPARELPAAERPLLSATDEKPLAVLVVDDVRQNADLLRLALGAAGHAVTIAPDGAGAVAAWAGGRFDMVLMDVHMPGMDGLAAARRIRALEVAAQRRRTPIVALTASVLDEDRTAAREAGMDGFVGKPVDLEQLRREMARVAGTEDPPRHAPAPVPDAGAPPPGTPLPRAARETIDALLRGEIDAEALNAVTHALQRSGDAERAERLEQTILQFDFEHAVQLLEPLAARVATDGDAPSALAIEPLPVAEPADPPGPSNRRIAA